MQNSSKVCQEINILATAFCVKFPGLSTTLRFQSVKYFKNFYCNQSKRSSFSLVNGAKKSFVFFHVLLSYWHSSNQKKSQTFCSTVRFQTFPYYQNVSVLPQQICLEFAEQTLHTQLNMSLNKYADLISLGPTLLDTPDLDARLGIFLRSTYTYCFFHIQSYIFSFLQSSVNVVHC